MLHARGVASAEFALNVLTSERELGWSEQNKHKKKKKWVVNQSVKMVCVLSVCLSVLSCLFNAVQQAVRTFDRGQRAQR